jgi:hypothetical protein
MQSTMKILLTLTTVFIRYKSFNFYKHLPLDIRKFAVNLPMGTGVRDWEPMNSLK